MFRFASLLGDIIKYQYKIEKKVVKKDDIVGENANGDNAGAQFEGRVFLFCTKSFLQNDYNCIVVK